MPPMAMAPAPAAPPMPAGPARKSEGFVERLARGVTGFFGSELPAAGGGAQAEETFGGGSEPTRLRGIIRINNDKRLAISFTLPNDIDWYLPEKVKVVLDGAEIEVEVELKHSTGSGQLAGGSEVRLVLRLLGALPGKPLAVHVPGQTALVVELV